MQKGKNRDGLTAQDSAARWRARPLQAGLLRLTAVVVPLASSVLAGVLVGSVLPRSHSWVGALASWLTVIVVSTIVLFGIDRLTRRLLPIATLLKLSMLFPDRAPSRYKVARSMAGSHALAAELEQARQHGISGDRQQAAETVRSWARSVSTTAALAATPNAPSCSSP